MKKLVNLGKVLNKAAQKEINGGFGPTINACGGCSDLYVCPNFESNECAFINSFGDICRGTYSNGGPCCA